jgi:hypothetical protein
LQWLVFAGLGSTSYVNEFGEVSRVMIMMGSEISLPFSGGDGAQGEGGGEGNVSSSISDTGMWKHVNRGDDRIQLKLLLKLG